MWKEAADSGEILSNIALGDDCAARGGQWPGTFVLPPCPRNAAICRISSTLRRCACVWPRPKRATPAAKKALSLAAEARQGFSIKAREHEPDAEQWLAEADQLIRELTSELPARATAYDMESLQLD